MIIIELFKSAAIAMDLWRILSQVVKGLRSAHHVPFHCGNTGHAQEMIRQWGGISARISLYGFGPHDRREFDRHWKIARRQLGEAAFKALAAEGRRMPLEQAIAYALETEME